MMMVAKSAFQCFHLEENFPFSTNVIEYVSVILGLFLTSVLGYDFCH